MSGDRKEIMPFTYNGRQAPKPTTETSDAFFFFGFLALFAGLLAALE
jgi:hypothetical protein